MWSTPCAHFLRKSAVAMVVIEAVGRPEAWEWAVDMVRKGGTVNFFGGSRQRNQSATTRPIRLHYSEITLKATFHQHRRKRFGGPSD